jgi:hypothetical protein
MTMLRRRGFFKTHEVADLEKILEVEGISRALGLTNVSSDQECIFLPHNLLIE